MASRAALELLLQLKGDAQAAQGLRSAQQDLRGLATHAKTATNLLKGVFAAVGGYAVVLGAVRLVNRAVGDIIPQAREARAAGQQLNAVFESTGGIAGVTKEAVYALAAALQDVTNFEDDLLVSAQAMLLTFTKVGREIFPEATELALDLAVAMDQDLKTSVVQVGKALNDPIAGVTALTRVGITFTKQQKEQIKTLVESGKVLEAQRLIMAELQRQVGGSARAAADPITQLGNAWGNLKEAIGGELLPDLFRLAKTIIPLLNQAARDAPGVIRELKTRIVDTAKAWIEGFGDMELGTARSVGRIAGFMVGLAKVAVAWGQNVVGSLAVGIASAVGLVTKALNFLGSIIGGLLKPGSPPRLLPDLDSWGRGAAEAWLAGWTEADFGALGDFAGEVQGALKALAGAGGMDERDVVPRLLGSRQAFAQLLQDIRETGRASAEAFAAIRQAAGPVGEQAEELARRYARVAEATGRLAEIQERLRGVEASQQDRLDAGRLGELEAILADPRASAGQRERALLEQEQIRLLMEQRDLQAEVDAAQGDLDAYRSRLDVETETRDLLGQQKSLIQSLLDKVKEMLDPLARQLRGWQLQQTELQALIRLAEIDYALQNDKLTAAQRLALELERQELTVGRMIRAQEAAELGIDLSGLANVEVVLADFRKGAGDALGEDGVTGLIKGVEDELDDLQAYDLGELLKPVQTVIDEMTLGFEEGEQAAANVRDTLGTITLPEWLQQMSGGVAGGKARSQSNNTLVVQLNDLNDSLGTLNGLLTITQENLAPIVQLVGGLAVAVGPLLPMMSGLAWISMPKLNEAMGTLNGLLAVAELAVIGLMVPLLGPLGLIAALAGVDLNMQGVLGEFEKFVKEGFIKGVLDVWKLFTEPVTFFRDRIRETIDAYRTLRDLVRGGTGDTGATGAKTGSTTQGHAQPNALGTAYFRGGLALVGERGPEIVALPRGSRIWPAQQSLAMAGAMGGRPISVSFGDVYVRDREDAVTLAWEIVREIRRRER